MTQYEASDGRDEHKIWSSRRQVEQASGYQTVSHELLPNVLPRCEEEDSCIKVNNTN
jgi:hypothetical protein